MVYTLYDELIEYFYNCESIEDKEKFVKSLKDFIDENLMGLLSEEKQNG